MSRSTPSRRRRVGILGLLVLAASLVTVLQAQPASADASAIELAPGCGSNTLAPNDDGSSGAVPLLFPINFFGTTYNSLYVNNNGNVTFEQPQSTFTPYTIDANTPPIIAPFFADVDTRNPGSARTTWGPTIFEGHNAFCVNWIDVGYYSNRADKLNDIQLIIVDRQDIGGPGNVEIVFNYGTITWETGSASGGTNGFGGTSAGAGFSAGTGVPGSYFEIPGSRVNGAFLDGGPNSLAAGGNTPGVPGRFRFITRFTGLTPSRLLDTRPAPDGPIGVPAAGRLAGGNVINLDVTGRGGVPETGVGAVVLNLTYTAATLPTFLTVYPSGTERPLASSANPNPGETRANMVIAPVGVDGNVNIFNNVGEVHVIADVLGWYPVGSTLNGVAPSRILDTRPAPNGPIGVPAGAPVGQGQEINVQVTGVGGVPSTGVGSVVLNLTGTQPTLPTYVTVYPTGAQRPNASNLNLTINQTAPNLVIARVGANGQVTMYNNAGSVHLIADVIGWLPDTNAFTGLNPSRILDTRGAPEGPIGVPSPAPVGPAQTVSFRVTGVGGVPSTGVGSVVLNVTATGGTAASYITAYPTGGTLPTASNINTTQGSTTPNMVIVPVGTGGQVTLYNNAGSTDLIADVLGWFPG